MKELYKRNIPTIYITIMEWNIFVKRYLHEIRGPDIHHQSRANRPTNKKLSAIEIEQKRHYYPSLTINSIYDPTTGSQPRKAETRDEISRFSVTDG